MPMDKSRYPRDWAAIALSIKTAADWTCQQCGRPCFKPGEDSFDFEERLQSSAEWEKWLDQLLDEEITEEHGVVWVPRPGRFILTVAHLDQNPANNAPSNLKALCSVCHLRHDAPFRKANSQAKRERQGQLNVFDVTTPSLAGHALDPSRIQHPLRLDVE